MAEPVVDISPAEGRDDVAEIRRLFVEYGESLNFDLCFQGFDEELDTLPGQYSPPGGALLLARVDGRVAGGVGVRPIKDRICEMKRLFVRPGFRGFKLGRRLAERIIVSARDAGYEAMRLDTIDSMTEAQRLYQSLGFVEIPPYYDNPLPRVFYYELALAPAKRKGRAVTG